MELTVLLVAGDYFIIGTTYELMASQITDNPIVCWKAFSC